MQYFSFCVCLISLSTMSSRFFYAFTKGRISFFFLKVEWCSIVHIFIHSSLEGYLGCSHMLTVVNNAAMNREVQISLWDLDFVSFDIYLEVGLMNHMVALFWIFWGPSILLSIAPISFREKRLQVPEAGKPYEGYGVSTLPQRAPHCCDSKLPHWRWIS